MSIPPLVCSTPPPPDQCDDDKDPEDFDLQYNLSQEDYNDSRDYDYGEFSTYNHYKSPKTDPRHIEVPNRKLKDTTENIEINTKSEVELGTNITCENNFKYEEEINIEDLNLTVDEDSITNVNSKDEQENNEAVNSDNETNIPDIAHKDNIVTISLPVNETVFSPSTQNEKESEVTNDTDSIKTHESDELSDPVPFTDTLPVNTSVEEPLGTPSEIKTVEDDGFGEFDDFQFVNTANSHKVNIVHKIENPWDNYETGNDFSEFKANFDEVKIDDENFSSHSLKTPKLQFPSAQKQEIEPDNVNDFGDFDDFQTSANDELDTISSQTGPVINLQTPDNEAQVMESISKVLTGIFEQEISETESVFEGKIESYLSETWGHLMDIDTRQPYMVNWNSSLGQKTLLKALCIDSRNILFGPKWSSNMPKYAVNLSSAPLQPQKQPASANVSQSEVVNPDKVTSKSANSWNDPFTSDGQESCHTDNAAAVSGSTGLEVFEAVATKPGKIYPSTLNVQPMRQISLPDTHIFTPTDSETPRSKTIHYDSGPAVLLPQHVTENKNISVKVSQESDAQNFENDSDWEFQDFQASSVNNETVNGQNIEINESEQVKDITYQTEVLQPVKVNPTMPTLNWPEPGQVNDTFEDFSDFFSSSTWSNEKQDTSYLPTVENKMSITETPQASAINPDKDILSTDITNTKIDDGFDDEFDTFQSALPPSNVNTLRSDVVSNAASKSSPQISSSKELNVDCLFPKIENIKSEPISFTNSSTNNLTNQSQMASFFSEVNRSSTLVEQTANTSQVLSATGISTFATTVLQPTVPTPANTPSQKGGQILQPLSLESYSKINWPNPGINLQDLSRFNPVETLPSLKNDFGGNSKVSSPAHSQKISLQNKTADDDIWGEFVSSKPKQAQPKKQSTFADDDEWTDFVSSPVVKPQNGLSTISLNVHTNLNMQKSSNQHKPVNNNQIPIDIPTLNYVTPKSNNHKTFSERHFQNL